MGDCDVLLTAAAAGEAPVGLELTGDASFCLTWTTTHVPCITLPVFKGPHGLPIGAQLVARRNADRAVRRGALGISRAGVAKSFTAEDTKDAKENKSLTAEAAKGGRKRVGMRGEEAAHERDTHGGGDRDAGFGVSRRDPAARNEARPG